MLKRTMLVGAMLAVSWTIALAGPATPPTATQAQGRSRPARQPRQPVPLRQLPSEHPPTSAMNKASETTATSSQDAQRQMQGQPTAAEQSKTATGPSDKDCWVIGFQTRTRRSRPCCFSRATLEDHKSLDALRWEQ